MKKKQYISFLRELMPPEEKELLLHDLTKVLNEYFEISNKGDLDITRYDDGYSICLLLKADRLKQLRVPK